MWVGVRFLTTRVSPNDTYGTKMVMRGDGTGKKKRRRRNEREEEGKKDVASRDIGMKNR